MDNFRRPRPAKKRPTMDGFLNKKRGMRTGSIGFDNPDGKKLPSAAARASSLESFSRTDGFHAATQPQIAIERTVDETIDIPYVPSKKRRSKLRFGKPRFNWMQRLNPLYWIRRFKAAGWKERLKMIAVALGILLVLIGAFLAVKAYIKYRNVLSGGGGAAALQEGVDPSLLNVEGDGRINILVLGKGGYGHDGPDLTDTILLVSIDPIAHEAGLLSIPRDLYVKTPNNGEMKINSVYALEKERVLNSGSQTKQLKQKAEQAGLDAIKQSVNEVLGVPIHYRVMVDFEAFRKAIDTVGGISIDVKTQLYDPTVAWENDNNPLIASVGMQQFDGKRALLYARSRHGSARGDFDRSERQREVILALRDKVLSAGTFSNPIKINQLLDAFGNHIKTDINRNDLPRLYEIIKEIPGSSVKSIGLADPPNDYVTTDTIGGLSVVVPKEGLFTYDAIHNYVRNTLRDSFLKMEDAEVMILNGTTKPGLAKEEKKELKSYGYKIGYVGDAPNKNFTHTVLVNLRGEDKRYTAHYLEKRLGVTAQGNLPPGIDSGTADFVIILGSNE